MDKSRQWEQMEDAEDAGLKAIMGDRCQRPGEWTADRTQVRKKRRFRKGLGGMALWGTTAAVFGHWLGTGQMTVSAALPCMMVCAGLAGYRLGRDLAGRREV